MRQRRGTLRRREARLGWGALGWGPSEAQVEAMKSLPLQTSPKIFAARILNHLLLFVNQTLAQHRELLTDFREAAPPFRGKVLGCPQEGGMVGLNETPTWHITFGRCCS